METSSKISWFEFVADADIAGLAADFELPFDCEGDAFVFHVNGHAFIRFEQEADLLMASQASSLRLLNSAKAQRLGLPKLADDFSGLGRAAPLGQNERPLFGDRIARWLGKLGFQSCASCSARQTWLNRLSAKFSRRFSFP